MFIGISGKKQSGKSTLAEFIQLNSKDIFTDYDDFKNVSMADPLKKMLVEVMGVDKKVLYGSDEDKKGVTQYKWEDLPHHTNKTGYMTGRELMQQIGTEVFRKMNSNVWVEAFLRSLAAGQNYTCSDARFPNEITIPRLHIQESVMVRLTADKSVDNHASETSLDKEVFDWNQFDIIIDNTNMDINEKNAAFIYGMMELGYSMNDESMLFVPYFSDELVTKVTVN